MKRAVYGVLLQCALVVLLVSSVSAALLDPSSRGFDGQTRSDNYDSLVHALIAPDKAVTSFDNKLWVPWFSSSSQCEVSNLHSGDACSGGQIDFQHNCMVSDEFSQVALLVAMSNDQDKMNQVYNTIQAIKSDKGVLPSWRVYRNGNTIESCKPGINGNCDTASDADARFIMSLFTASKNEYFGDSAQKARYATLASALAADFVRYEVVYTCKPSSFGKEVCYWLASGAHAKSGGLGSTDFGYTGYYADAIIAMLQTCAVTGDQTYCRIADDFTLNYLQASAYDLKKFTVPPGKSFKWTNLNGIPTAQCTSECSPVQWDSVDAPRAVSICQALYYADLRMSARKALAFYKQQFETDGYLVIAYRSDGTKDSTHTSPWTYALVGRAAFALGDIEFGIKMLDQIGAYQVHDIRSPLYGAIVENKNGTHVTQFTMQESILTGQATSLA